MPPFPPHGFKLVEWREDSAGALMANSTLAKMGVWTVNVLEENRQWRQLVRAVDSGFVGMLREVCAWRSQGHQPPRPTLWSRDMRVFVPLAEAVVRQAKEHGLGDRSGIVAGHSMMSPLVRAERAAKAVQARTLANVFAVDLAGRKEGEQTNGLRDLLFAITEVAWPRSLLLGMEWIEQTFEKAGVPRLSQEVALSQARAIYDDALELLARVERNMGAFKR